MASGRLFTLPVRSCLRTSVVSPVRPSFFQNVIPATSQHPLRGNFADIAIFFRFDATLLLPQRRSPSLRDRKDPMYAFSTLLRTRKNGGKDSG